MNDLLAAGPLIATLEADLMSALRGGAELIAKDARAHAPELKTATAYRVPGALRNAIGVQDKTTKDGKVGVSIGVDETAAFYWRFQEFGFHAVGGKRIGGGANSRPSRTLDRVNAGSARFIPGLQFMQHAFDANQQAVVEIVKKQVQATLLKANS